LLLTEWGRVIFALYQAMIVSLVQDTTLFNILCQSETNEVAITRVEVETVRHP